MAPLAQGHQTAKKGTQMQPTRHTDATNKAHRCNQQGTQMQPTRHTDATNKATNKAPKNIHKGTGSIKKGTNKRSEL